jgi:hypothetical protein
MESLAILINIGSKYDQSGYDSVSGTNRNENSSTNCSNNTDEINSAITVITLIMAVVAVVIAIAKLGAARKLQAVLK